MIRSFAIYFYVLSLKFQERDKENMAKHKSRQANSSSNETSKNWADVAIELIRAILSLLNSGNIIGLIIAGIVLDVSFMSYKLTPEDSGRVLLTIIDILKANYLSSFIFSMVFFIYVLWSKNTIKNLKKEIKRLAKIRTELMQGLSEGSLTPLNDHHPSKYNDKED